MTKLAYVLDDEKSWRDHYQRWLLKLGFSVKTFHSINSLTLYIKKNENYYPDIAIIDMSLSSVLGENNLDGLTVIQPLKNKYPNCRLVLATGYSEGANFYYSDVDLVLEKKDKSHKKALTQKRFREEIEKNFSELIN